MKRWLVLSGLVGSYLIYGLWISQYDVSVVNPGLRRENPPGYYDYKGTTHIDADPQLALSEASTLGFDFIAINPLNRLEDTISSPRYFHRTLIIPSYKLSLLDSRWLFLTDRDLPSFKTLSEAQTFLTDILSRNSPETHQDLVVLAHPLRPGFTLPGEFPSAANGLELINMRSLFEQAWRRNKLFCIWSLLTYPFNPRLATIRLFDDPIAETKMWDEKSQNRRTTVFTAQDDIAAPVKWLWKEMHVLSLRSAMNFTSTHVWLSSELTGEPTADSRKIVSALKAGQGYLAVDGLGDPKGFFAEIVDGRKHFMTGSETHWSNGQKLVIRIPSEINTPVEVAVFKDGLHFMSSDSTHTEMILPSAGVYRVVVFVRPSFPPPDTWRWLPWIFTNSFYLR